MTGLEGMTLGRYQLQQPLGQGGMAEVYLAYDELMKRNVAVKVLSGNNATYVARFHREAEAIGRLNHDHILPAFDYGEQGPWRFLVMPYIEHGTLRERLANGPLTLHEAESILQQLASALQYAHDQRIIHRDIKPSNVLFRDSQHVYLADFGLAKSLEDTKAVTQSGALMGTPEYMSPDLAKGPATISSDVYALGVLLYQMVTGRVPFSAETPIAIYMMHLHEQPVAPSLLNTAIPPMLDKVILRALEKDPRRRYRSVRSLASAYTRALVQLQRQEQKQQRAMLYTDGMPVPRTGSKRLYFLQRPSFDIIRSGRLAHATHLAHSTPQERLIVAERDIAAMTLTDSATIDENLPITPMPDTALLNEAAHQATTLPPVQRSVLPPRRSRHNTTLVWRVVAVGVFAFILLPLISLYYFYTTSHHTDTTSRAITSEVSGPSTRATAQAQHNTTPILTDSMSSNSTGYWAISSTCAFTSGSYHISVTQTNFLQPCPLLTIVPSSMKAQVNVTLLSGHDAGMLLDLQGNHFYDFEITDKGQFFFRRHDDSAGSSYVYLIPTTSSATIIQGQANTLTISANNGDFQLFINNTLVGEVHDTTYSGGSLALVVGTLAPQTSGEGAFTQFSLFK